MKPATITELKNELKQLPPAELVELCLRLTKYKLENKELLNYLLFEAHDEDEFAKKIEALVQQQFAEMTKGSQYLVKKGVRKILRLLNKHIKYSGKKATEVQLRLFFCRCMKQTVTMRYNTYLTNLYEQQLKKIRAAIDKLHEDLQYDFQKELEQLEKQ
ncbi:hypothetical protein BH09BAC1_BH09BAC1_03610 [soil metagenome]